MNGIFDTRCEKAEHERAMTDAHYLLNVEEWPSRKTPISARMLGNLARAYLEIVEGKGVIVELLVGPPGAALDTASSAGSKEVA